MAQFEPKCIICGAPIKTVGVLANVCIKCEGDELHEQQRHDDYWGGDLDAELYHDDIGDR